MITYLKSGKSAEDVAEADAKVRRTVEDILADIESRGDAAVRELAEKFDGMTRDDFRLSPEEIEEAVSKVSKDDLDDIKFAQAQVRNFAQKQKDCLQWRKFMEQIGSIFMYAPVRVSVVRVCVVVNDLRPARNDSRKIQ